MTTEIEKKIKLLKKLIILYKKILVAKFPIRYIIIHHTATDRDFTKFESINQSHRRRGFPKSKLGFYCGYQYFIEESGMYYHARTDFERGAHTRGYNLRTIGICLAGHMDFQKPTSEQLRGLESVINMKLAKYGRSIKVVGHSSLRQTNCPGKYLEEWLREFQRSLTK